MKKSTPQYKTLKTGGLYWGVAFFQHFLTLHLF
ncbi:MAG: hypothetical protein RL757_2702 [Bacteroidota bacterium]|jgi:hypothetical protein